MKSRIKNALKHEVEVAGRSVSVLVLLAVFLAGSGGAALLSTFGTVSGSANINQAFTVDGKTGQGAEVVETVALTGGESVVTNHNFRNNLNQTLGINVTSMAPEELSLSYRFVDNLVATTEYSNFDDEQANVTGNMTSEFAYNPVDDKVGVHAYGQTVYRSGSNPEDAESYAGFSAEVEQNVVFDNNTRFSITYSEAENSLENMTSTYPFWIRLHVDVGADDIDANGQIGETWIILEKTVRANSGATFSGGDDGFGDDAVVYKKKNPSVTSSYTEIIDSVRNSNDNELERVDVLTGSGSDDATYMEMWFYGLEVNPSERGHPSFLQGVSGNFTRRFDPGVTEGAVIAEARINAYGTGISYSADFNYTTS